MDPLEQVDFSKDSTIAIAKSLQGKAKIKIIEPLKLKVKLRKEILIWAHWVVY